MLSIFMLITIPLLIAVLLLTAFVCSPLSRGQWFEVVATVAFALLLMFAIYYTRTHEILIDRQFGSTHFRLYSPKS